jgi:hypothetical protein
MGKKGKRDNNDYHRAEWKRDMVEEEGLPRVVRPQCYKRRGAGIRTGSGLRRRSCFSCPRRAKRFRPLPNAPQQGSEGKSPSCVRPGTQAASLLRCFIADGAAGGPEKEKRCVRLHDSKTRSRGRACAKAVPCRPNFCLSGSNPFGSWVGLGRQGPWNAPGFSDTGGAAERGMGVGCRPKRKACLADEMRQRKKRKEAVASSTGHLV